MRALDFDMDADEAVSAPRFVLRYVGNSIPYMTGTDLVLERAVPTGGEGLLEVAERAGKALQQIRDSHPEGTVVLVGHAIVLRLIVLDALGLGPERLWSLDASPAGLTEIEYLSDWTTVHRMNTLAPLRGLPA